MPCPFFRFNAISPLAFIDSAHRSFSRVFSLFTLSFGALLFSYPPPPLVFSFFFCFVSFFSGVLCPPPLAGVFRPAIQSVPSPHDEQRPPAFLCLSEPFLCALLFTLFSRIQLEWKFTIIPPPPYNKVPHATNLLLELLILFGVFPFNVTRSRRPSPFVSSPETFFGLFLSPQFRYSPSHPF